jgi:translin
VSDVWPPRTEELAALAETARAELAAIHEAREAALRSCRTAIQASGRAIRAIHRGEQQEASASMKAAQAALGQAQAVLVSHPTIAAAGFIHDAAKEVAEACLFSALASGSELPGHAEVGVTAAAWLNGLAEAASELRRHLLDRLRAGDLAAAEAALDAMDESYAVLITIDEPDAVTGGLRRTTDALRAVLERSRSDLTTTMIQSRLQSTITEHLPKE